METVVLKACVLCVFATRLVSCGGRGGRIGGAQGKFALCLCHQAGLLQLVVVVVVVETVMLKAWCFLSLPPGWYPAEVVVVVVVAAKETVTLEACMLCIFAGSWPRNGREVDFDDDDGGRKWDYICLAKVSVFVCLHPQARREAACVAQQQVTDASAQAEMRRSTAAGTASRKADARKRPTKHSCSWACYSDLPAVAFERELNKHTCSRACHNDSRTIFF